MKIKRLHIVTFGLSLLFFTSLSAQSDAKREVGLQFSGINFSGFNSFGAFYKKQISENKYRRIRFFTGRASTFIADDVTTVTLFLAGAIGREKRRSLGERLELYTGPEFSGAVGYQKPAEGSIFTVTGGAGFVLGLQHSFGELWAIQIETVPTLRVGMAWLNGDYVQTTLDADISNSVAFGVVRKF